jgi:hypothetical protein
LSENSEYSSQGRKESGASAQLSEGIRSRSEELVNESSSLLAQLSLLLTCGQRTGRSTNEIRDLRDRNKRSTVLISKESSARLQKLGQSLLVSADIGMNCLCELAKPLSHVSVGSFG